MKKFIELIRTKEREEKAPINAKKAAAKEISIQAIDQSTETPSIQQPRDLFWDDYSDVGYC